MMVMNITCLLIRSSCARTSKCERANGSDGTNGLAGWANSTVLAPLPLHILTCVLWLCLSWVMRWMGRIGTAIVLR